MTREEARDEIKNLLDYIRGEKELKPIKTREDAEAEERKGVEALEMAIQALEQESCEDMGEVSDGYHTFNQLYYQRAVLFATIVNSNKDKAWKSFKHYDGKYCFDSNGEWFIVGVDTPQGSYTYHYEKKYWDMFDCKELQCGKEWDGHTEEDVTRLLSLEQQPCEDCISREAVSKLLNDGWIKGIYPRDAIMALPSVTPKESEEVPVKDLEDTKDDNEDIPIEYFESGGY